MMWHKGSIGVTLCHKCAVSESVLFCVSLSSPVQTLSRVGVLGCALWIEMHTSCIRCLSVLSAWSPQQGCIEALYLVEIVIKGLCYAGLVFYW